MSGTAAVKRVVTVLLKIDHLAAKPIRFPDVPKTKFADDFLLDHAYVHPDVPDTHKNAVLHRQDGTLVPLGLPLWQCRSDPSNDYEAVVFILKPPTSAPSTAGSGVPGVTIVGTADDGIKGKAASVSTIVGPQFELDAGTFLNSCLLSCCPWVDQHSSVGSRTGITLKPESPQAAIFGYASECSQDACVSAEVEGCSVLTNGDMIPALPALDLACRRLSGNTRLDGNVKYVLGECYSGFRKKTVADKTRQLETLVDFMIRRKEDAFGIKIADPTQIVGLVVLVLCAEPGRRVQTIKAYSKVIAGAWGPTLQRFASARRFLLFVLEQSQAPSSFALREIAASLRAIERRLGVTATAVAEEDRDDSV